VTALDAAAAQAAARKYLVPERLVVVAVGDRQKIDAELKKLNLGSVEYRDADGNVIEPKPSGLQVPQPTAAGSGARRP